MRLRTSTSALALLAGSVAALALSGCAMTATAPSTPILTQVGTIQGDVHGGRQPIAGARLFLMALGTGGYGTAATSLITSGTTDTDTTGAYAQFNGDQYVTTRADGTFSLGGTYTCTSGEVVYLVSLGGNTGGGTGQNYDNSAAGELAVLGVCPASGTLASNVPYVYINEASTMAGAYALAPYASSVANIASSGSTQATIGSQNAVKTAYNMYNTTAGGSALTTTPSGNGTPPQGLIDALANSLASCVNSVSASSVQCTNLFSYTPNATGTQPLDTASAAINIARLPAQNVSQIFNLPNGVGAPFMPALTTAPNDFTAGIIYTGGLSTPQQVAIDNNGNIWVNNGGNGMVAAFNPDGSTFSGSPFAGGSGNALDGLAIGTHGNIWVVNNANNTIHEYNSINGKQAAGSPFSNSALSSPSGISFDALGNFFVANAGANNVLEFDESGNLEATITSTNTKYLSNDTPIVVDNTNNYFWVGNLGSNLVTKFSTADGTYSTRATETKPYRMAVDSASNLWTTNRTNSTVYEINKSGVAIGNSPYTGGGINTPVGVSIDGAETAWITNSGGNSLSEIANGSVVLPYTGFQGYSGTGTYLYTPTGIAVDFAGNIWVTNSKSSDGTSGKTITEFVGLATPVLTPIIPGSLGRKP